MSLFKVIMQRRVLDWIGDEGGWEGILVKTRNFEQLGALQNPSKGTANFTKLFARTCLLSRPYVVG